MDAFIVSRHAMRISETATDVPADPSMSASSITKKDTGFAAIVFESISTSQAEWDEREHEQPDGGRR